MTINLVMLPNLLLHPHWRVSKEQIPGTVDHLVGVSLPSFSNTAVVASQNSSHSERTGCYKMQTEELLWKHTENVWKQFAESSIKFLGWDRRLQNTIGNLCQNTAEVQGQLLRHHNRNTDPKSPLIVIKMEPFHHDWFLCVIINLSHVKREMTLRPQGI